MLYFLLAHSPSSNVMKYQASMLTFIAIFKKESVGFASETLPYSWLIEHLYAVFF